MKRLISRKTPFSPQVKNQKPGALPCRGVEIISQSHKNSKPKSTLPAKNAACLHEISRRKP